MEPAKELELMGEVANTLKKAEGDTDAVRRILQWNWSAFLPAGTPTPAQAPQHITGSGAMTLEGATMVATGTVTPPSAGPSFSSLPDLYSKISPASDPHRALVVAYWFQVMQGEQDLDGFSINKELKHLGHAVGNITTALTSLIERKPQLVIQTRKSGNSKQARKLYRLTDAGIRAVERLIAGGEV
jgi:hypothetical protein